MKIEQIYTGCLAQGAYYILSGNEAAVIDPLRDIKPYLDRAAADGATIKYIFETHFHADFVSGHIDLARASGATIVYGPGAKPAFPVHVAYDNELLPLGNVHFKVLYTPGHTMESACFLLVDEKGKDVALFSGDTLFIGDVGRPDLAQKAANRTKEELAGILFDSLRNKILPLGDDVVIYPAHGAGSACGKNMSTYITDSLGNQRKSNYALRAGMSKEEFIAEVTNGLMPPPAYFPQNVRMNKEGYSSIGEVLKQGLQPLSPAAFEAAANETGALLLDTRTPSAFAQGFIPNAINIGIDGNFAPWAGALIADINQPILIIAEEGREAEVVTRLARVGYDHSIGYLKGGMAAWIGEGREVDRIDSLSVAGLAARMEKEHDLRIIDVRKGSEFLSGHVVGAENIPLDYINEYTGRLDKHTPYFVHCAGGYRSMIFISILRSRGVHNLVDVQGGFKMIRDSERFVLSPNAAAASML